MLTYTLDLEDINALYELRSETVNEVAFLVSKDEIQTFIGEYSYIDIPSNDSIIGHTHPKIDNCKYNPPSKQDIISAISIPYQDWFIVEEQGVWIYNIHIDDLSEEAYQYIINRFDMTAIGLMNEFLTIDEYLKSVNNCVIQDGKNVVSVIFHDRQDITELQLIKK